MTTEGRITPGKFHVLELDFTPESRAAIQRTGVSIVDRLELPRGRHQVRFAVHQPNGKTGSIVADVEIPDYTKEPVMLSGVVLSSERTATDRTLLGDEFLNRILGAEPTARRRFSQADTVTAFAEVYATSPAALDTVRVTGTLATADGATAKAVPATERTAEPGRAGYTARLPLANLAPGEYVLTIEARAGDDVASRSLLLTVEEKSIRRPD
jgi:hypothetical protein